MAFWARKLKKAPLTFSEPLRDACLKYDWPGNIRELENFVRRYLIIANEAGALKQLGLNGGANGTILLPSRTRESCAPPLCDLKSKVRGLKMVAEKEAILRALELTRGCRKEAARMLNISVRALQYKIRQFESTTH
jgi:two-component system, NtrC family, response regulator AtoC